MPAAPSLKTTIATVTLLAAVPRLAASLYTPSMPSLTAEFGASMGQVKLTFTAYIAGLAIGQILYGPISDSVGRKPVLLIGLTLFSLLSLACMFAPSIEWLAVGRFLQACCAAAGGVLSRAIVRDLFGPERTARAFAFVAMATTLSPALGPLLGGQLQDIGGWQTAFGMLAVVGLALLIWVTLRLPETRPRLAGSPAGVKDITHAFGRLLRSPPFVAYTLSGAGHVSAVLCFFASAPFLLIDVVGITPSAYGYYSCVGVAGYFIGNFLATRASNRSQIDPTIRIGAGIAVIGSAAMLILALLAPISVMSIMLPFAVLSCGSGMALPNCLAGSTNRYPQIAGTSSALSSFLQMAASAAATMLLALTGNHSAVPLALFLLALSLLSLIAGTALKRWPEK